MPASVSRAIRKSAILRVLRRQDIEIDGVDVISGRLCLGALAGGPKSAEWRQRQKLA
jgi:hypothetical protein